MWAKTGVVKERKMDIADVCPRKDTVAVVVNPNIDLPLEIIGSEYDLPGVKQTPGHHFCGFNDDFRGRFYPS